MASARTTSTNFHCQLFWRGRYPALALRLARVLSFNQGCVSSFAVLVLFFLLLLFSRLERNTPTPGWFFLINRQMSGYHIAEWYRTCRLYSGYFRLLSRFGAFFWTWIISAMMSSVFWFFGIVFFAFSCRSYIILCLSIPLTSSLTLIFQSLITLWIQSHVLPWSASRHQILRNLPPISLIVLPG